MKRITRKWGLLFLALNSVLFVPLNGQLGQLDFVYGGIEDAEKILQAYLEPYANILGSDLNAGWYNTARPHELGGLDVTATVTGQKLLPACLPMMCQHWYCMVNWIREHQASLQPLPGRWMSGPHLYILKRSIWVVGFRRMLNMQDSHCPTGPGTITFHYPCYSSPWDCRLEPMFPDDLFPWCR